jgi:uncharacterized membrane protein
LFLGALLSDHAYSTSYQVQWTNFSSWLLVGALVLTGVALLWAGIDLLRRDVRMERRSLLFMLLLLATFVLGFINALIHARDAWAVMPAALILSFIVAVLAVAATWVGFATPRAGWAR